MSKNLALTPPMGWNSWNTFTWNINEALIKEAADAMVESGLKDAGYEYIVIDDCWSLKERDENGYLVPDPAKFPNGMKAVADYVHSKGLKFGMYSCAGVMTCAGHPSSYEHEFQDAETFASWGVDFLKYDYCFKPTQVNGDLLYKRMGMALRNCGRDILFSACNWGQDGVHNWIRETGAHMFRSTGDIQDSWVSIKNLALSQFGKQSQNAIGCWNDIDMLVVGMYGGSNNDFIRQSEFGCTDVEYKTHFSLWAMMNSPLMIGCDIRNMTEGTKNILMNKDIIAINQDPDGRAPYDLVPNFWGWGADVMCKALVRPLANGDYAIGIFNLGEKDVNNINLLLWDIGLPYDSGYALEIYDCWEHKVVDTCREKLAVSHLKPHDCAVFRAKLVKV